MGSQRSLYFYFDWQKHPSAFSIEEIVDAELQNGDEEEKRNLKDELLNFISKKKELEFKDFESKYNPNKKNEEVLSLENKIKEQRLEMLKKDLTPALIAQCEKEYYSYSREIKNHSYFVGMACNKLIKSYFRYLGISPKKEEEEEIREKLKIYFKEKNNIIDKKPYIPPENIKNFYEVEKPDDDIK